MISNNMYREERSRIIKCVDALQEPSDNQFFFVRRNKDGEAAGRAALFLYTRDPAEAGNSQYKEVEG
jgi:hypothetical protein